ncbi:Clp protease N-terminal domain-containing protein [Streptomyces sp. NPDC048279]|uniref:Clp protease N-terminal domain-containing protein n=1 Tax=Streptomyces sp. NPDC048279 TaxID=3154714 RepID=UPI0034287B37
MFEQFAAEARATVAAALEETTLRGDRRIGTEHLLLGVLHDPGAVRALGTWSGNFPNRRGPPQCASEH